MEHFWTLMESEQPVECAVGSDSTPSEAVLRAVAEAERTEPFALEPPLYSAIDPEALDEFVGSLNGGSGCVEFTYQGYEVRFHTSDSLLIRPRNGEEATK